MRGASPGSAFAKGIIVRLMHIAPAGDRALLVTLPDASAARIRAAAESVRSIAGVVAAIIGHESIYVIGISDADAVHHAIEFAVTTNSAPKQRPQIEISFHE